MLSNLDFVILAYPGLSLPLPLSRCPQWAPVHKWLCESLLIISVFSGSPPHTIIILVVTAILIALTSTTLNYISWIVPCPRSCVKYFMCIIPFDLDENSIQQGLLWSCPFYRCGNWVSEGNNWLKVTELTSSRLSISTQTHPIPCFIPPLPEQFV